MTSESICVEISHIGSCFSLDSKRHTYVSMSQPFAGLQLSILYHSRPNGGLSSKDDVSQTRALHKSSKCAFMSKD